jgi:hypothetical protein
MGGKEAPLSPVPHRAACHLLPLWLRSSTEGGSPNLQAGPLGSILGSATHHLSSQLVTCVWGSQKAHVTELEGSELAR